MERNRPRWRWTFPDVGAGEILVPSTVRDLLEDLCGENEGLAGMAER
jgi:hypothetical protein